MTISQMAERVRQGTLRSQELVSQGMAKIEENRRLNAVIEVNPDALDIAKTLDCTPEKKGLLYGVPILIKDNISTGDKMHTSSGSLALAEHIAKEDAPAASQLRQAGAVLLGKTNMTEFANYMTDSRTSPMPSGYSSRGGKTIHPVHPDADPSGSSTGSAVALAAGLCIASIGSETYGSIVAPAQHCGIVGIKPTEGLISKKGVLPISFTLDTLGPMARSVEDAALVLSVFTGKQYDISYKNTRVGICRNIGGKNEDSEWLKANEELIQTMRGLGLNCIELPNHSISSRFVFPIMRYEFKYGINSYLEYYRKNPSVPKNLQEIIEFNEKHAEIALKYDQGGLIAANKVPDSWKNEPEYVKAISDREDAIAALDKYFDDNGIDVLFIVNAHYGLASATGFPSMSIPIGKTKTGLPIGCCMIARRLHEETLLRVMKTIEIGIDGNISKKY